MKYKILNLFALILMAHFFLLIASNNLPSFLSSSLFYIPAWFLLLSLYFPSILFTKMNLKIYLYLVFYYVSFNLFWKDIVFSEQKKVFIEMLSILTAYTLLTYYISRNDMKGLKKIILVSIIFIIFSSLTSLVGFVKYPLAARELAGVLARDGDFETITRYQSLGIGGYGYFASLIFIPPIFLTYLKLNSLNYKSKLFVGFSLAIIYMSIVSAQYFANFLISTLAVILIIFKIRNYKVALPLIIILSIILLTDVTIIISDSLLSLSQLFSNYSELSHKLADLGSYIKNPNYGGQEVAARSMRFPVLLSNFFSSPVIGSLEGNQHLHWMNKLSLFGLLGTLPFFYIIWSLHNDIKSKLIPSLRYGYSIVFYSYILLGMIKAAHLREIMIMIFFIVPGYFLLQSYSSSNQNGEIQDTLK